MQQVANKPATPAKASKAKASTAPVAATVVTATPAQAIAPTGLQGCVLLPLQASTASHGAAIFTAAQSYPVGPLAAAKAGAAGSYVTGAASWLACAALGYHATKPGKGKMVGYVAAWYCPTSGQVYATTGQPLPTGGHGAHHGGHVGAGAVWGKLAAAVLAYHASVDTTAPAWAQPGGLAV